MKKFFKSITNLFRFIIAYLKLQDHNRKVDRASKKPEIRKKMRETHAYKTIGEKIYDGLKALGYTKNIASKDYRGKPDHFSPYRLFMMNQHKLRYSEKHEGLKLIRSDQKNKYGFKTLSKA